MTECCIIYPTSLILAGGGMYGTEAYQYRGNQAGGARAVCEQHPSVDLGCCGGGSGRDVRRRAGADLPSRDDPLPVVCSGVGPGRRLPGVCRHGADRHQHAARSSHSERGPASNAGSGSTAATIGRQNKRTRPAPFPASAAPLTIRVLAMHGPTRAVHGGAFSILDGVCYTCGQWT